MALAIIASSAPSEMQSRCLMPEMISLHVIGNKKSSGFTLIEIGVVLAIIAILGSVSLTRVADFGLYMSSQKAQAEVEALAEGTRYYWLEHVDIACVYDKGRCTALRYSLGADDQEFSAANPLTVNLGSPDLEGFDAVLPSHLKSVNPIQNEAPATELTFNPHWVKASKCVSLGFTPNRTQRMALADDRCFKQDDTYHTIEHSLSTLKGRMLHQLAKRMRYSVQPKVASKS